ncbi:MAG TPA: hypothetical protein VK645_15135, partial [Chitinophagaceae bacterium]|nr:hypothetical protein [Chitinophagaceae bacterium]
MRKIFMAATILTSFTGVTAQLTNTYNTDSLKQILLAARRDTDRIWALNNLGRNIQNSDTTI